jgi:hypothetical protein
MAISQEEILQAIADGSSTTKDLCQKFPALTPTHAAVVLSRYLGKGIIIPVGSVSDGKRGRPHIVFHISKNGEDKLEKERLRLELGQKQVELRQTQEEADKLRMEVRELKKQLG